MLESNSVTNSFKNNCTRFSVQLLCFLLCTYQNKMYLLVLPLAKNQETENFIPNFMPTASYQPKCGRGHQPCHR